MNFWNLSCIIITLSTFLMDAVIIPSSMISPVSKAVFIPVERICKYLGSNHNLVYCKFKKFLLVKLDLHLVTTNLNLIVVKWIIVPNAAFVLNLWLFLRFYENSRHNYICDRFWGLEVIVKPHKPVLLIFKLLCTLSSNKCYVKCVIFMSHPTVPTNKCSNP